MIERDRSWSCKAAFVNPDQKRLQHAKKGNLNISGIMSTTINRKRANFTQKTNGQQKQAEAGRPPVKPRHRTLVLQLPHQALQNGKWCLPVVLKKFHTNSACGAECKCIMQLSQMSLAQDRFPQFSLGLLLACEHCMCLGKHRHRMHLALQHGLANAACLLSAIKHGLHVLQDHTSGLCPLDVPNCRLKCRPCPARGVSNGSWPCVQPAQVLTRKPAHSKITSRNWPHLPTSVVICLASSLQLAYVPKEVGAAGSG